MAVAEGRSRGDRVLSCGSGGGDTDEPLGDTDLQSAAAGAGDSLPLVVLVGRTVHGHLSATRRAQPEPSSVTASLSLEGIAYTGTGTGTGMESSKLDGRRPPQPLTRLPVAVLREAGTSG